MPGSGSNTEFWANSRGALGTARPTLATGRTNLRNPTRLMLSFGRLESGPAQDQVAQDSNPPFGTHKGGSARALWPSLARYEFENEPAYCRWRRNKIRHRPPRPASASVVGSGTCVTVRS